MSWRRNRGGGVMEKEPYKKSHGGILEEDSWGSDYGGVFLEELLWRRNHERNPG